MLDIQGRPSPNFLIKTNTTVTMGFVSPPLEEVCKDVIISYPPVTFGIDVENAEESIPGFPIVSNCDLLKFLVFISVLLL